jgi:hypothetical protein
MARSRETWNETGQQFPNAHTRPRQRLGCPCVPELLDRSERLNDQEVVCGPNTDSVKVLTM